MAPRACFCTPCLLSGLRARADLVFIDTGLPGALTVLAFGQLLPQLVAATHPATFMNLPAASLVVNIALVRPNARSRN